MIAKTMSKIAAITLLALCNGFPQVANAAELYMCEPSRGESHPWQGSGACHGNATFSVSLSELYPDLELHYNSIGNYDMSGLGRNWTLSEISFIKNFSTPAFASGNSYEIPLGLESGWNGKLMALRRDILNDYFTRPSASDPAFYQQTMQGTTSRYLLSYQTPSGPVYRLAKVTNRFGEVTSLNVGVGLTSENITYSDGTRVNLNRSGNTLVFSRDRVTVTLTLDTFSRLTQIVSSEGQTHNFTYPGNTTATALSRLLTHSWSETRGGPTFKQSYSYDSYGKLISFVDSDGSTTVFTRNFSKRIVTTRLPNGQVLEETFDANKRLINELRYIVGKKSSPLSQTTYSYHSNGMLSKIVQPQQTITYAYQSADPMLLATETTTENGSVTRTKNYHTDRYSYLPLRQTTLAGDGSVVSDLQWTLPNALPFLTSMAWDRVTGSYQRYAYSGNQTTVSFYDVNDTRLQIDVYDKRNLISRTQPLAPAASRTQTWTYVGDQASSTTFLGKTTTFAHDGEGRVTSTKSAQGEETTTAYDDDGYVTSVRIKYPTGVTENFTYQRSFYSDGAIRTETEVRAIRNPGGNRANGVDETTETEYSDSASGHQVLVSRLNGVETFRK